MKQAFYRNLCLLSLGLSACASIPQTRDKSSLDLTDANATAQILTHKAMRGLTTYAFEKKGAKAGWIACSPDGSKEAAVVMHRDEMGFDPDKFCTGWIAQLFMKQNFHVIAVNRPGFVNSTGNNDFSGLQSQAAIKAAVKEASMQLKDVTIKGAWGYSSGAIAAAFFAKDVKNLSWLILGGGIYDLERQFKVSNDLLVNQSIKKMQKLEGDVAFERRSIAYDYVGIPKRIAMYHVKGDDSVPLDQANAFRDSLISQEYKVSVESLEGTSHDIAWTSHFQILQALLTSARN